MPKNILRGPLRCLCCGPVLSALFYSPYTSTQQYTPPHPSSVLLLLQKAKNATPGAPLLPRRPFSRGFSCTACPHHPPASRGRTPIPWPPILLCALSPTPPTCAVSPRSSARPARHALGRFRLSAHPPALLLLLPAWRRACPPPGIPLFGLVAVTSLRSRSLALEARVLVALTFSLWTLETLLELVPYPAPRGAGAAAPLSLPCTAPSLCQELVPVLLFPILRASSRVHQPGTRALSWLY